MTYDSQHRTILIVDDNVGTRAFAKRFLEAAGYTVVTAADGEEGLRFYAEHQSKIVLLLTDVVMPNINGVELADRVLGMDSQLPVLFMTGGPGREMCIRDRLRGAKLLHGRVHPAARTLARRYQPSAAHW